MSEAVTMKKEDFLRSLMAHIPDGTPEGEPSTPGTPEDRRLDPECERRGDLRVKLAKQAREMAVRYMYSAAYHQELSWDEYYGEGFGTGDMRELWAGVMPLLTQIPRPGHGTLPGGLQGADPGAGGRREPDVRRGRGDPARPLAERGRPRGVSRLVTLTRGANLRVAARVALDLGCGLRKARRSGELVVDHPDHGRIRCNCRRKDASMALIVFLRQIEEAQADEKSPPGNR